MPCVCEHCVCHARTLGLEKMPLTRAALRKAYRTAARLWHPDQFERDPAKRGEAEERFKQIQIAYRELTEHEEKPVELPLEPMSSAPPEPVFVAPEFVAPRKAEKTPPICFDGTPGCFVAPDFSPIAHRIIAAQLRDAERALALVDLSGSRAAPGSLAQYILLADSGIFLRDARGLVALLWYDDLGAVRLVERSRRGVAGLWCKLLERFQGREQRFTLEIWRSNGTLFHVIAGEADDRAKQILCEFLERKRPRPEL